MCSTLSEFDVRRHWKTPKKQKVCQICVSFVGYIFNHTMTIITMRKYTNKVDLIKVKITPFATYFFQLQRLPKLKNKLRWMFTLNYWSGLIVSMEPKGKKVLDIILMPSF